ncbi:flagellar filament capping protein FliD [Massilia sp. SM-13]|uniref:flagellar filament capping protein FliD n=1 Tax=Pseudoduganella rhizocola TaxID=3382643 RepID=UPI0038B6072F
MLDVNSIVSQLMAAEAKPLAAYDKKTAAYQATLSAYGSLSGAIGVFQSALGGLTKASDFQALTGTAGDASVLSASVNAKAVAGNYNVNVTQLAQAQTLTTAGHLSSKSAIGLGGKTTISFQFGNTSGDFGVAGNALGNGVFSSGISNGSLIVNGTAIVTDGNTTNARALAEAINAKSATTGVTATARPASSAADLFASFGDVTTGADGTYALTVGGVQLAALGPNSSGISAASIDAVLAGPSPELSALTNAGISFTGTAAGGDLVFTRADGANLTVSESVSGSVGAVTGGLGKDGSDINGGSSVTAGSGVSLRSTNASPISIAGSNPALAGLTAGTAGSYLSGGAFNQDATLPSGTVVIDATNNSLEGIRDAINKAGLGVKATIVSDGSANPYHLVLTSTATGANSSMKISLSGSGADPADSALADLLSYDPGADQKMMQTAAALDTKLNVNGIAVTSHSNNVGEAIQGVTLTVTKIGSSSLNISQNTSKLKDNLNGFVKAYNDLAGMLKKLTGYNADTETAGPLQGDSTAQAVQSQLRRMLSNPITGLSGSLSNLGQIGITFGRDGTLSLDSGKLQKAIDSNFADIGALFGAIGDSSDNQVSFISSTAATKPGTYALNITQMATQGALTSDAALDPAGTTTIDADTVWSLTLNDTIPSKSVNIASVTIPAGTYTPAELAKVLQSSINGSPAFSSIGSAVTATVDADGKLVLASSKYGSASNIGLSSVSGTDYKSIFGSAEPVVGTNVSGTLGGLPATGDGQTLTGQAGTAIEGLKIDITGGATGDRGTVSFSQGYAYQLNNLGTVLLDKAGPLTSRTDGINRSIKDIAKQRDKFAEKLDAIEARYRKQYTALDVSLSQMQTTQAYLTQQLAALAANS